MPGKFVRSLAELLYTLLRKKPKPSNKSHTADPHPSQSWSVFLVLASHWDKIKCLLAKENWLLEEPTHEKQTWEFWWLAFHSSLKNLPKLLEQHYPLVLCFVAACMCLERQIKCHLCHCSRRAVGSFCGWDGAQVGVTWPGRGRSDELSPGLPHVLSRCQHRTAQVPPAACLGHGSLWPSSTALCGRTGISAPLSARFVFLISFYLKVYQLLYYQAELSLQFLPLSSSFSFFVPQDNHCVWSQLPLLIFHYSLI